MKTFKLLQIAVVTLVLSVIVGCSDQFTAPTSGGESVSQSEDLLSLNSFNTQIRLRPYASYEFNVANTGLEKITAIDVSFGPDLETEQLFLDCENIAIYGALKHLNCHGSGFNEKSITVKNLSSKSVTLNVALAGERKNNSALEKE